MAALPAAPPIAAEGDASTASPAEEAPQEEIPRSKRCATINVRTIAILYISVADGSDRWSTKAVS
jgi:hypothetical protein